MIHFIGAVCHLFGFGHVGVLVYFIMTALNTITIGTFFRCEIVEDHTVVDRLTSSCCSGQVLHTFKGIGPWFAYTIPSVLVIGILSPLRSLC